MKHSIILAVLLFCAVAAHSQDTNGDGSVTYLVPLNAPQIMPGANGTRWQTELWVHNGAAVGISLWPCNLAIVGPPCEVPLHAPGMTEQAFPTETISYSGPFLFDLSPGVVPEVSFSSRLFEHALHAQPAGVMMPVIREDHFYKRAMRFIAIPSSKEYRVALRVYDPRHVSGSRVRVEFLTAAGAVITSLDVALSYNDSLREPGYVGLFDLAAMLPASAALDPFDVRVIPLTEGMEYWGVVSVTDQQTQQVLLITAD